MNFDAKVVEEFARFVEHLRTDIEGVMQAAVLLDGSNDRFFALTEENVVVAELEAGLR